MNPTQQYTQETISKIVSGTVSSVIIMPSTSQPAGATDDACLYTVNFSDGTLPRNIVLSDLKASPAAMTAQATTSTTRAAAQTAAAAKLAGAVAMVA